MYVCNLWRALKWLPNQMKMVLLLQTKTILWCLYSTVRFVQGLKFTKLNFYLNFYLKLLNFYLKLLMAVKLMSLMRRNDSPTLSKAILLTKYATDLRAFSRLTIKMYYRRRKNSLVIELLEEIKIYLSIF